MRTIAHLSDLHFGNHDPAVALRADLLAVRPSLVVVSGDLSQRAFKKQFAQSQEFLEGLPFPRLIVPGNHDVPLFDPWSRAFRPLAVYRANVTDDLFPTFVDDEVAILGLPSARGFTLKNGWLARRELDRARVFFSGVPASTVKIVVTHHPLVRPGLQWYEDRQRSARVTTHVFRELGVDAVLSGHLHRSYAKDHGGIRMIHAGTATGKKLRGETNAYNVVTVASGLISVAIRRFNGTAFIGD
jgi:3',5'-cyclic AMP phosphodiesterase CpdA